MLRGLTELSLDSKGRLVIPTRYRDALDRHCEGHLVVTIDIDPSCFLLLYPLPDWEDIERKLVKLPSLNELTRQLQRQMLGYATECDMDGSGRILLPPPLRTFAGLEKSIVMAGQGNKFEIWDASKWNAQRDGWVAARAAGGPLPPELESLSL